MVGGVGTADRVKRCIVVKKGPTGPFLRFPKGYVRLVGQPVRWVEAAELRGAYAAVGR